MPIPTEAIGKARLGTALRADRIWLLLAPLAGAAFSLFLVLHQHRSSGGVDGFPLDDSWIHLTYARNLHDHHSFAYFPGDRTSSGSTSPLYTLILALAFSFTSDEKLLSFVLGILFQAAFLWTAGLWARRRLGDRALAAACVLLLAFDSRLAILSVSGMETSLFLFLISLAFWARAAGRPRVLGSALGLAVWVRPEALMLAGIFALDALLARPAEKKAADRLRGLLPWAIPCAAIVLAYLAFNAATGGAAMPSTFAAKHAYYRVFPRSTFIRQDLRECFFSLGWIALLPFGLWAIGRRAVWLARGKADDLRAETGWVLALPLAYLAFLPFSPRFSRYLAPALPALAVLSLEGLREVARRFGSRSGLVWRSRSGLFAGVVLVVAALLHGSGLASAVASYRQLVQYHASRHERCGLWLAEHTPPEAVIATHDVGAIGYYSRRRIVDVVGLIQPDAIAHLHRPDYVDFLNRFFERERVTHLAVLRNWLEVTNVPALYLAEDAPEYLEVFPWIPGRTHLVPEAASGLNQLASQQVKRQNLSGAIDLLRRSTRVDPRSAKTWLVLGSVYEVSRQLPDAERCYREALRLYPDSKDGRARLATVLRKQGKPEEGG